MRAPISPFRGCGSSSMTRVDPEEAEWIGSRSLRSGSKPSRGESHTGAQPISKADFVDRVARLRPRARPAVARRRARSPKPPARRPLFLESQGRGPRQHHPDQCKPGRHQFPEYDVPRCDDGLRIPAERRLHGRLLRRQYVVRSTVRYERLDLRSRARYGSVVGAWNGDPHVVARARCSPRGASPRVRYHGV